MTGKIVTIHQPNYLPWLGFFSKIKQCDTYVILDNVKYTKNSVINRTKIRIKDGWCYLTIPINRAYYDLKICDVKLPENQLWQENHWATLRLNYLKSEFFSSYEQFFEKLYTKKIEYLSELNQEIIFYLFDCLDINVEIFKTSKLNLDENLRKTDLLIEILRRADASTYFSGPSGKNYLEIKKFSQNDIELKFFEYKHPIYKQRFSGFEPNLSAIDMLFNIGEESMKNII